VLAVIMLAFVVTADAGASGSASPLPSTGLIFDITHFDVLPLTSPLDAEQVAYAALFAYRNASETIPD
jgi:hypothetical protein